MVDLKQVFDLVGYQFSLIEVKVKSALEHWQTLNANPETSLLPHIPGLAADASRRVTDDHRKASPPWSPPNEADTVALKSSWRVPKSQKGDLCSQFIPPHLKWWL